MLPIVSLQNLSSQTAVAAYVFSILILLLTLLLSFATFHAIFKKPFTSSLPYRGLSLLGILAIIPRLLAEIGYTGYVIYFDRIRKFQPSEYASVYWDAILDILITVFWFSAFFIVVVRLYKLRASILVSNGIVVSRCQFLSKFLALFTVAIIGLGLLVSAGSLILFIGTYVGAFSKYEEVIRRGQREGLVIAFTLLRLDSMLTNLLYFWFSFNFFNRFPSSLTSLFVKQSVPSSGSRKFVTFVLYLVPIGVDVVGLALMWLFSYGHVSVDRLIHASMIFVVVLEYCIFYRCTVEQLKDVKSVVRTRTIDLDVGTDSTGSAGTMGKDKFDWGQMDEKDLWKSTL
ncbi:hypothetical protein BKA69DRAFT_1100441 [Paraphysoderma sedebokerense]|nr:hypothetical protein BKA69DRAFT_1100441 [Paraphysoderma sedebokerense]